MFGHLSDRIGRKNMYLIGAVVTGVFGFIYFAMVDTGSEPIIFLAIILSLVPHDMHVRAAGGADRGELYRPAAL